MLDAGRTRHQLAKKPKLLALFERNRMLAQQIQLLRLADRPQARLDQIRVDQIGQIAFEPEQHRFVRAVPFAGRAQRAEQVDLHAAHEGEQVGVFDMRRKTAGGDHRPDRVRARRTDTDLEQIEDADVHGVPCALRCLVGQVPIAPHVNLNR